MDMEFIDPPLIESGMGLYKERLERAICNRRWLERNYETSILHLLLIKSDHESL